MTERDTPTGTHPRLYTDGRVWACQPCDEIFPTLGAALDHCGTKHRPAKLGGASPGR